MSMPAARLSDPHLCPMTTGTVPHVGGPIMPTCAINVLTGNLPQARISDKAMCTGPVDMIVLGAFTVLVKGMPAARMGDMTAHGGVIVSGFPTVLIGNAGSASLGAIAQSMVTAVIGDEAIGIAGAKMKEALIGAARQGLPFCEQCTV
ncbi:MAG TPA: PAAR domain-containing protein [Novosphingobium sp.]|nr:PAAR domain-containing protein [Novosphingobium sp.]